MSPTGSWTLGLQLAVLFWKVVKSSTRWDLAGGRRLLEARPGKKEVSFTLPLLSSLRPGCHEVRSFAVPHVFGTLMFLPHHRGASWPWTEIPQFMSQNEYFLSSSCSLRYFSQQWKVWLKHFLVMKYILLLSLILRLFTSVCIVKILCNVYRTLPNLLFSTIVLVT
jgi:hypothetical protein